MNTETICCEPACPCYEESCIPCSQDGHCAPPAHGWSPEHSIHRRGGWKAQYARMLRWRDRIEAIDWSADSIPDTALDDVYAFFQNCFALRDWISEGEPDLKSAAYGAVDESPALKICRDLCNGTKHFNLSHPGTKGFAVGVQYRAQAFVVWTVLEDGEERERLLVVLELAADCVAAWLVFLECHGLSENLTA